MSLESAFRTFVEEAKISRHAREEILEELEESDYIESNEKVLNGLHNQQQELEDRVERLEAEHDLRGGDNDE